MFMPNNVYVRLVVDIKEVLALHVMEMDLHGCKDILLMVCKMWELHVTDAVAMEWLLVEHVKDTEWFFPQEAILHLEQNMTVKDVFARDTEEKVRSTLIAKIVPIPKAGIIAKNRQKGIKRP